MDLKGKLRKVSSAIVGSCISVSSVCYNVFAEGSGVVVPKDAASVIGNAGSNAKVDEVGTTLRQVTGSVYQALSTVAVIMAVIALALGFVRIAINKSSQKRESAKDAIVWACFALVLIGGSVAIISALMGIGSNV